MLINEFPIRISNIDTALHQSGDNLKKNVKVKGLLKKETEEFHTSVSRGMFVTNRAILDINQTVTVLSTMFKEPDYTD